MARQKSKQRLKPISTALPTGTNLSAPEGITFDRTNGQLYVTNNCNNTMTVYDQNGNQITTSGAFANLHAPRGIAFDPANGHLYVVNDFGITVYDQSGNQIATSGGFPGLIGLGIAFDPSNQLLYATSGITTVSVYDQNGNPIAVSGKFPNLHFPSALVAVP